MKYILILIIALIPFTFCIRAHAQADAFTPAFVVNQIPTFEVIGRAIFKDAYNKGMECMAMEFLKYEYGDPDKIGERPSVEKMQNNCRKWYGLEEENEKTSR